MLPCSRSAVLACAAALCSACTTPQVPAPGPSPHVPASGISLQVPAPQAADSPAPPARPASGIKVALVGGAPGLCEALDGALDPVIVENADRQCIQYGVYRDRDPPNRKLACEGKGNSFEVSLMARARGGQRCVFGGLGEVSCGYGSDPMKRVKVVVSAPLTWSPDWKLDTHPFAAIDLLDECNVRFASLPFLGLLAKAVPPALEGFESRLRQEMASRPNLREKANHVWRTAGAPIELAPGLWLLLNPLDFGAGEPTWNGDVIRTTGALAASPLIVRSALPPPASQAAPLPKLHPAPPGDGFVASADATITWERAAALLRRELVGKSYERAAWATTLTGMDVYGAAGSVVLGIHLAGAVRGTAYLTATPVYDAANDAIRLADVGFTEETKQALAAKDDWLLSVGLEDDVQALRFKLDETLTQLGALVPLTLHRDLDPHLRVALTLASARPAGVYLTDEGIVVRAEATGSATLAVH